MADGNFATLVSKDTSLNSQTNVIFTGISDGTDLALVDGSGNLQIIAAANSGVDIGDVTINNAAGASAVNIQDGGNSITVDGTVTATVASDAVDDAAFTIATDSISVSGYLADETTPDSVDEGDVGAARMTLDRKQLMVLVDSSTDSQRLGIDASGNAQAILAANSGVDIGDVDVTSIIPLTGATNLGKAVDAAAGGTDTGVAMLAVRDDALTTLTPADGDYTHLRVDSTGALHVTGSLGGNDSVLVDDAAFTVATSSVTAVGYLADETTPDSVDEGDIGAARMTLDRRQIMVLSDATTESQRLGIDSSGHAQVDIAAVSVTAVPVSKDSSANSETNPIFVKVTNTSTSASEVHDYDTATVAGSSTDNHDYTVVNTTFLLKQVHFASSGAMKVEVQTGPVASLVTIAVGFIPKAGGKNEIDFNDTPREVPVASTGTVRVIRTNREGSSQDVYTTIVGNDV